MKKFCYSVYLSTLIIFSISLLGPLAKAQSSQNESPQAKPVDFNAKDIWNEKIHERPDHKVLVIQNRKYTKSGKFEIGLDFGNTLASAFHNTLSGGLRAAYYFSEYWGLQAFTNISSSWFTKDGVQVDEFFKEFNFAAEKEFLEPGLYSGLGVSWSPVYGKFAFFRSNIIHFDIYGGLGLSMIQVRSRFFAGNSVLAGNKLKDETKSYIGSLANLGLRVFLTKHWLWNTELRHTYYRPQFQEVKSSGTVRIGEKTVGLNNWQVTTGISVLLGGN